MEPENFTYRFSSALSTEYIFETILDVRNWWNGVYEESIQGKSENIQDVFTFSAGGGVHFTTQEMVEKLPNQKIVWQVTSSKLTFLSDPEEWLNTRFSFELLPKGLETEIVFTHEGLSPELTCYDACSNGWMQYLTKLQKQLQTV